MGAARELPTLVLLVAIEVIILHRGQRRLFWASADATGSRLIAYLLALPGTVLHELAHYLACRALGVAVGRQLGSTGEARTQRVRLFWPRQTPEGIVLGGVPHARTDPLRQALISTAPLVLIPPLLALATVALLGPNALAQLPDVLTRVPLWQAIVWCYVSLSCGQAVFPSPGDRIGAVGVICLLALATLSLWIVAAAGGSAAVADVLAAIVGVLALPTAAAALLLLLFAAKRRISP